jgi:hypothetical protein
MTRPQEPSKESLPVWESQFSERKRRAVAAAHRLTEDQLASHDAPVLIAAILEQHAASSIVPRFDLKWNALQELGVQGSLERESAPPMQLILKVPCEGAATVIFNVPNRSISGGGTINPPLGNGFPLWAISLTLTYSADTNEERDKFQGGLSATWTKWQEAVIVNVRDANILINEHRVDVENAIRPIIESRRNRVVALRAASANLLIPLAPTIASVVGIPVVPKMLTLSQVERAASSGAPELALASDIADSMIEIITSFSRALERLPRTANRLAPEDEETIRDVLLFILNANYGGLVTGETFIGEGKSDILLRWRDRDAFIAECKFWHSKKEFSEAIDQLLGYTVWRDTRIALILFIRDRVDVSAVIDKAVDCLVEHGQFLSKDNIEDGSEVYGFSLMSPTDTRRAVRLTLIPVALPARP